MKSLDLHKIRKTPLYSFPQNVPLSTSSLNCAESWKIMQNNKRSHANQEWLIICRASTSLTLDVINDCCFQDSWSCLDDAQFSPEWKAILTRLFEPVPVTRQLPGIMFIMASLPISAVERIAPDLTRIIRAKGVNWNLCAIMNSLINRLKIL